MAEAILLAAGKVVAVLRLGLLFHIVVAVFTNVTMGNFVAGWRRFSLLALVEEHMGGPKRVMRGSSLPTEFGPRALQASIAVALTASRLADGKPVSSRRLAVG